jgi:hypothetical protein
MAHHAGTKGQIVIDDPLYFEAQYMLQVFLQTGIFSVLWQPYNIIKDYLIAREWECASKGLCIAVQELTTDYGYFSGYLKEFKRTARLRERYKNRILFIMRSYRKRKVWTKEDGRNTLHTQQIMAFLRQAPDLLRRVQYSLLTDKQHSYLLRIEHLLGIYWDDLSQSENGLAPRKDIHKWKT